MRHYFNRYPIVWFDKNVNSYLSSCKNIPFTFTLSAVELITTQNKINSSSNNAGLWE